MFLASKLVETEESLELSRRTGVPGMAFFLPLWLTLWGGGGVAMAYFAATGQMDTSHPAAWFFLVIFWSVWFALVLVLLDTWFGRETLVVGPAGVTYYKRVLRVLRAHQHAEPGEVKAVVTYLKQGSEHSERGIRIDTSGQAIIFGRNLPEDELEYLRFRIEHAISLAGTPVTGAGQTDSTAHWPSPPYPVDSDTFSHPVLRPADSTLRLTETGTVLELQDRGWWSWPTVGWAMFLNIFVGGGVSTISVFWILEGHHLALTALLVLPAAALAAAMLGYLGIVMLSPYTVHHDHLGTHHRRTVSVLGWVFPLDDAREITTIAWLEIHRHGSDPGHHPIGLELMWGRRLRNVLERGSYSVPRESDFDLVLVDGEGRRLSAIEDLSHGEARWLASHLAGHLRR